MSKYGDLLKDPRWQKKRLEIMNRDSFACQLCGNKTKTLNVHHLAYKSYPWDVADYLLITLCEDCHVKEERVLNTLPMAFNVFSDAGVLHSDLWPVLEIIAEQYLDGKDQLNNRSRVLMFIKTLKGQKS